MFFFFKESLALETQHSASPPLDLIYYWLSNKLSQLLYKNYINNFTLSIFPHLKYALLIWITVSNSNCVFLVHDGSLLHKHTSWFESREMRLIASSVATSTTIYSYRQLLRRALCIHICSAEIQKRLILLCRSSRKAMQI